MGMVREISGVHEIKTGLVEWGEDCNASRMPDIGFPYVANNDARVLILGSMPSRKSLALHQYYAHPQNVFWPIMGELFGFAADILYEQRLEQLLQHRIALWDVAFTCVRHGSLDQAIEMDTVVANDFATFFAHHQGIQTVFFNGRKAQQLYRQLVLREGYEYPMALELLPSTSPAHASMRFQEKLSHWQAIKQPLELH